MQETQNSALPKENSLPQPKEYDRVFIVHGKFNDGDTIAKESNMLESLRTLEIHTADIEAIRPLFAQHVQEFDAQLPHLDSYPNALSRDQLVRVLATLKTVTVFNGGTPSNNVEQLNQAIYGNPDHNGTARLSDFGNKRAMTCIELTTLGQMLLGGTEDIYYVSGSADLAGNSTFEGHTFQLIKTRGSETHPYAILDLSNPIQMLQPDGTNASVLYCAPITPEQFEFFKRNEVIDLEYKGQKRSYQYGFGPNFPITRGWD